MKALTPWRPTPAVSMLRDEIDDLLPTSSATHEGWVGQRVEGRFAPAFDIIVKDGAVVMKADLPGIDPKSVDVTVHRDRLTINGERKAEREEHETGAGVPRGSLQALLVHHAAAGPH